MSRVKVSHPFSLQPCSLHLYISSSAFSLLGQEAKANLTSHLNTAPKVTCQGSNVLTLSSSSLALSIPILLTFPLSNCFLLPQTTGQGAMVNLTSHLNTAPKVKCQGSKCTHSFILQPSSFHPYPPHSFPFSIASLCLIQVRELKNN